MRRQLSLLATLLKMFEHVARAQRAPTGLEVTFAAVAHRALTAEVDAKVRSWAICLLRALLPLIDRAIAPGVDRDAIGAEIDAHGNPDVAPQWREEFDLVTAWAAGAAAAAPRAAAPVEPPH